MTKICWEACGMARLQVVVVDVDVIPNHASAGVWGNYGREVLTEYGYRMAFLHLLWYCYQKRVETRGWHCVAVAVAFSRPSYGAVGIAITQRLAFFIEFLGRRRL